MKRKINKPSSDPLGRDIPAHLLPKKTNSKFPFSYKTYLEESKKPLNTKIKENYKVTSWSKSNFEYSIVKPDFLESILLRGNPQFTELVSYIEEFNEEVKSHFKDGSTLRNGPWRQAFYLRLQSLLIETIYTREQEIQLKFLGTVYEWAHDQMARNDSDDIPTTRPLTAVTLANSNHDPKSKGRPYSSLTKTTLSQTQAVSQAKSRIQSAKETKELPSLAGKGRPMSSFTYKEKKPLNTRPVSSGAMRPISAFVKKGLEKEAIEEEPIHDDDGDENEIIEEEQISHDQAENETGIIAPSKLREEMLRDYGEGRRTMHEGFNAPYERLKLYERRKLIPEEELIYSDNEGDIDQAEEKNTKSKAAKNQEVEVPQIEESHHTEEEPQTESQLLQKSAVKPIVKKVGKGKGKGKSRRKKKIDPIHLKGISLQPSFKGFREEADLENPKKMDHFDPLTDYVNYAPSQSLKEKSIEARFLKEKQKELKVKREDEEFCGHMMKWAKAKSDLASDQNRKVGMRLMASEFEKVAFDKEEKIKAEKERIDNLAKADKSKDSEEGSGLDIELEEDNEESDNEGLQYDKRQDVKRPFSSIPKFKDGSAFIQEANAKQDKDNAERQYGLKGLEEKAVELKIDEARKVYSNLIDTKPIPKDKEDLIKPASLSVYQNVIHKNFRPFSAITLGSKATISTNAEISEVMEIKNRLAQNKICVDYKTLTNALVIPLGFKNPEKFMLPRPGSALMSNPFSNLGVQKKMKTKKGSKRTKKLR